MALFGASWDDDRYLPRISIKKNIHELETESYAQIMDDKCQ